MIRALQWAMAAGTEHVSPRLARVIRLTNQTCLALVPVALIVTAVAAQAGIRAAIAACLAGASFFAIAPFLHSLGATRTVRGLFPWVWCSAISVVALTLGTESGIAFFLAPALTSAFVLFTPDERLQRRVAVLLPFVTTVILSAGAGGGFQVYVDPAILQRIRLVSALGAWILTVAPLMMLASSTRRAKQDLQRTLGVLQRQVAENERAEALVREQQAKRAVGQLIAGVAHELNTPLQYVESSVEYLCEILEELPQTPTAGPPADEVFSVLAECLETVQVTARSLAQGAQEPT